VRLKLFLLALCSLFVLTVPSAFDVANADTKVVAPFPELEPNFIQLSPMPPKDGPGGEGEITISFTQN